MKIRSAAMVGVACFALGLVGGSVARRGETAQAAQTGTLPVPPHFLERDAVVFSAGGVEHLHIRVTNWSVAGTFYPKGAPLPDEKAWRVEVAGGQITLWGEPLPIKGK